MSKDYAKITSWLLAAWFTFTLVASALHLFNNVAPGPPLALLFAVLVPLGVFLAWYRASSPFREFVLSLNPRMVTLLHAWRVEGFVFLVLYSYRILPGMFALPAGWGDMATGATAPFVAFRLANAAHKKSFILWQLLGVADLVVAVGMGAIGQFISPTGITTAPMSVLPLSLIPTFAVPLLLMLHFISIAQARRWSEQADAKLTERAVAA